jgi:capsular polysaccharide biosynthesis protein
MQYMTQQEKTIKKKGYTFFSFFSLVGRYFLFFCASIACGFGVGYLVYKNTQQYVYTSQSTSSLTIADTKLSTKEKQYVCENIVSVSTTYQALRYYCEGLRSDGVRYSNGEAITRHDLEGFFSIKYLESSDYSNIFLTFSISTPESGLSEKVAHSISDWASQYIQDVFVSNSVETIAKDYPKGEDRSINSDKLVLLIFPFLFMLFSLAIAFLIDSLDNKITDIEDIQLPSGSSFSANNWGQKKNLRNMYGFLSAVESRASSKNCVVNVIWDGSDDLPDRFFFLLNECSHIDSSKKETFFTISSANSRFDHSQNDGIYLRVDFVKGDRNIPLVFRFLRADQFLQKPDQYESTFYVLFAEQFVSNYWKESNFLSFSKERLSEDSVFSLLVSSKKKSLQFFPVACFLIFHLRRLFKNRSFGERA